MASSTQRPLPAPGKISTTRVVLGCLAIPVILVVLLVAFGLSWWVAESRRARRDLAVEVQKVRDRGEPLTTVELNDYYVAAPGRPDMTQEILGALALCDSPGLKALAKGLPIVGQGPNIPDPPANWEQLGEVEVFLAQHQAALDVFHEVAVRKATARYPVDLSIGISVKLSHVQSIRDAARVLALEAEVAMHQNRPDKAVAAMCALLALGHTLETEPMTVSQLVRIALFGLATKSMAKLTRVNTMSDGDLRALQYELRRFNFGTDLRTAINGERGMGYMSCIDPLAMNSKNSEPTPEQAREIALRPPRRVADAALLLRNNSRMIDASEENLFEALRVANKLEAEMDALLKGNKLQQIRYIMTALVSPAYRAAVQAFARSAAQRDSADAAIAAELYRRRHGAWPKDLATLVPDFLPAAPLDPFTNQPLLVFSTPVEFKVYSVGKDLVDNGGDFSKGHEPDVGFTVSARAVQEN